MRDPRYSGFWKRFAAISIDSLLLLPFSILSSQLMSRTNGNKELTCFLVLSPFFVGIVYQLSLISKFGQTIGKMVMRITVFAEDEKTFPKVIPILKRILFMSLPTLISLFLSKEAILNGSFFEVKKQETLSSDEMTFLLIAFPYYLLDLGTFFIDKRKRCLHDIFAKTVVVNR
jgi:uncharacterized RDD family membrane protein YckC